MALLEGEETLTLDALNLATQAWVEQEYHRTRHSELNATPLACYVAGANVARPCPETHVLSASFRITVVRRQRRSDGTVSLGARGLNIQCFEHKLDIDDQKLYPLYAKCVELDVPVNIHCGVNFSTKTLMTHGHPLALDRVMCAFPELRVCASPPGWPWINELLAVAWRHPNVWIGTLAMRPRLLATPNSGYEPLLQYGRTVLKDKMMFGTAFPMMPVEDALNEFMALEMPDDVQRKWLEGNAKDFLRI